MHKVLSGLFACGALTFAAQVAIPLAVFQPCDQVIVYKAERRMDLVRDRQVVSTYRIALGLDPSGPKLREGDFRTPEGAYRLARRNASSDFFLSIQISYPSDQDIRRARSQGYRPGGSVMIHGLPNRLKHPPEYYQQRDWTDGCIAVSNSDMVEIWLSTGEDTPIDIRP
ncbi:MAG TPA: L,D-transpeptidase family protein [Steroidobacteraceae bacterium]|jgi:murein L,D-transpeptidase YafK